MLFDQVNKQTHTY